MQLHTARLRLRPWNASDREPFAALGADPEVMRYFPSTLTRDESDAVVERIQRHFDVHGYGFWAVEELGGAPFIGFVGLFYCEPPLPFAPAVEIGWRLARAHQGRGYATEAARAALDYGFGELGLREIVAYTTRANEPSRNVMRKLGMTHDPAADFDHPRIEEGHPLRRHVVYRIGRPSAVQP